MNWGKSIVLVFLAFGGFIGTMVYRMASTKVDLVRTDYYQTEIAYQQQIERIRHNKTANNPLTMNYNSEQQRVQFFIPANARKGEIHFFRPSDSKLDFKVPVQSGQSLQSVSTSKLRSGYWKIQITWTDGSQEYYTEEEITI